VEHGRDVDQQEGTAVGRSLGDVIDPHHPARPNPVLDYDRLLEPPLQSFGNGPPEGVHATPGRDRHHERDHRRWIAQRRLRVQRNGTSDGGGNNGDQKPSGNPHPLLPSCDCVAVAYACRGRMRRR
jgi:hypothetical protein